MAHITPLTFLFLITVIKSSSPDQEKLLKSQFIKSSDRCWYMNSSGHHFVDIIFKNLQRNYIPIITINDQPSGTKLKKICDGLIFVNDNKKLMLKSLMESLKRNAFCMRNNKLILMYFGDEDFVLDDYVVKEMHNKGLNVLLIKTHRKKRASIMNGGHLRLDNISIYAPFINKTITISKSYDTLDPVEDLFSLQKWRPNFNAFLNMTFRMSLINSSWCVPMMIREDNYKDGVEYRIIKEVSKDWKIKFQEVILTSKTGPWGQIRSDLKNDKTDLGTCSFFMSVKDEHNDGTYPHIKACETFFVPKPLPVNPSQYLYLPLSPNVWIGFVACSLLTAAAMYIMAVIGFKTNSSQWIDSPFRSLCVCIWSTFAMMTSQGINVHPNQTSLNILFTTWVLVCLLISVGYATGYTSLLTYPRYTKDINTIKDMVEQENLYWGDDYEVYVSNQAAFSKVKDKFFLEFLTRFKLENNTNDRLNRIQNRDYAIFVLHFQNKYSAKIDKLRNSSIKFKVIKDCLMERYVNFPLQENSPYTEIFNDKIHRLVEAGIIDFWLTDVLLKNNLNYMREMFSSALEEYDLRPLILGDLQGAFFLLSVGLLLSTVVFLIEYLTPRGRA